MYPTVRRLQRKNPGKRSRPLLELGKGVHAIISRSNKSGAARLSRLVTDGGRRNSKAYFNLRSGTCTTSSFLPLGWRALFSFSFELGQRERPSQGASIGATDGPGRRIGCTRPGFPRQLCSELSAEGRGLKIPSERRSAVISPNSLLRSKPRRSYLPSTMTVRLSLSRSQLTSPSQSARPSPRPSPCAVRQ